MDRASGQNNQTDANGDLVNDLHCVSPHQSIMARAGFRCSAKEKITPCISPKHPHGMNPLQHIPIKKVLPSTWNLKLLIHSFPSSADPIDHQSTIRCPASHLRDFQSWIYASQNLRHSDSQNAAYRENSRPNPVTKQRKPQKRFLSGGPKPFTFRLLREFEPWRERAKRQGPKEFQDLVLACGIPAHAH